MRRFGALALALAGCSAALPRRVLQAPVASVAFDEASAARALEDLVASLQGDSRAHRAAARALGLALEDADGRRAITGDPDRHDTVQSATVVTRVRDAAAVLAVTRCGNASVVPLRWRRDWQPGVAFTLVSEAHPGACRVTEARARGVAVTTLEPRELLVEWTSEDEDGDAARRTIFSALRLGAEGNLVDLTGPVLFGAEDDVTGAVRTGTWFVDDVLPPPRDIVLEVRPSRQGPGGAGPPVIERQVWRPRGDRLERVESITESVVGRSPGASPGFAGPR